LELTFFYFWFRTSSENKALLELGNGKLENGKENGEPKSE